MADLKNIDSNLSGDDNQNLDNNQNNSPANVDDFSKDIDQIFGNSASDNAGSGGDNLKGKTPFEDGEQHSDDWTGMTHEQLARKFQSEKDIAQATIQKLTPKVQRADALEQFYNELYENPEVRRAFIAELEPDLIKSKDPYAALEEELKKEFGEDYIPDEEEAKRPFTQSWKYYKKLSDLERKAQQSSAQVPKTLKELRTERDNAKNEQKLKDTEMKVSIMGKRKWDDTKWQRFVNWGSKLSPEHLAAVFDYAESRKSYNQGAPYLMNQAGGNTATPNEIESELKKFFG